MESVGLELPLRDATLQFAVLIAAALLVQLTLERLHLPGLVGLLVIGMLLGPGGLGFLPREPVVAFLGAIGLIYIMFLAGLEVDLDVARAHRMEVVGFGLLSFAVTFVVAAAVGIAAGFQPAGVLLLGAALSSHTLLAYPLVEQLGLTHHRPIVTAVGGTLLTDTLALGLLAVVVQLAAPGEGSGMDGPLSLGLLVSLVVGSLLIVPRLGRRVASADIRPHEKALFALAILLALSAAAELIGTEDILGAFLAGVCLNRVVQRREALHEHIEFVGRMLFIPFFFIETGMHLELQVFRGNLQVWSLAGVLLLVIVFGKSAAAWISGHLFGYSRTEQAAIIGMTIPQAAATLAVTMTAERVGLLEGFVVDAIILVIFFTSLLGVLLAGAAGRRVAGTLRTPDVESEEEWPTR